MATSAKARANIVGQATLTGHAARASATRCRLHRRSCPHCGTERLNHNRSPVSRRLAGTRNLRPSDECIVSLHRPAHRQSVHGEVFPLPRGPFLSRGCGPLPRRRNSIREAGWCHDSPGSGNRGSATGKGRTIPIQQTSPAVSGLQGRARADSTATATCSSRSGTARSDSRTGSAT